MQKYFDQAKQYGFLQRTVVIIERVFTSDDVMELMDAYKKNPDIVKLTLIACTIEGMDFVKLIDSFQHIELTCLKMWSMSFGDSVVTALTRLIQHRRSLTKLEVTGSALDKVNQDGLVDMFRAIGQSCLDDIAFTSCRLPRQAVECLAASIVGRPIQFKTIRLTNNNLGDETIMRLVDALQDTELQAFWIGGNDVEAGTCARELARQLATMRCLETFVIDSTDIGDRGAQALSTLITQLPSLHTLGLDQCGITDVAVPSIAQAIENSDTIRWVSLCQNPKITDASQLTDAIQDHPSLELLDLMDTSVPLHIQKTIENTIRHKSPRRS
jgi:Leucine-rich repeat (LRR) protein